MHRLSSALVVLVLSVSIGAAAPASAKKVHRFSLTKVTSSSIVSGPGGSISANLTTRTHPRCRPLNRGAFSLALSFRSRHSEFFSESLTPMPEVAPGRFAVFLPAGTMVEASVPGSGSPPESYPISQAQSASFFFYRDSEKVKFRKGDRKIVVRCRGNQDSGGDYIGGGPI